MKRFLYLFLACFWLLTLYLPPGYSWGEDKKDPPKDQKAPQESLSETVKGKVQKETEEVKKDTKESGRRSKNQGKNFWTKPEVHSKKLERPLKRLEEI